MNRYEETPLNTHNQLVECWKLYVATRPPINSQYTLILQTITTKLATKPESADKRFNIPDRYNISLQGTSAGSFE
jgi:hypothetical protein